MYRSSFPTIGSHQKNVPRATCHVRYAPSKKFFDASSPTTIVDHTRVHPTLDQDGTRVACRGSSPRIGPSPFVAMLSEPSGRCEAFS